MSGCAAQEFGLHLLDGTRRAQHCFLEPTDHCRYLWEYLPGRARNRAQRWIRDLKCRPSQAAACPLRAIYKECALVRAAQALRAAAPRSWVEQASWCPIPPSARPGATDHCGHRRVGYAALYGVMSVDTKQLLRCALRRELVLFDDVLTTGKHFKCAQARLQERVGVVSISACVLARRVLTAKRRGVAGTW
jgi:hypothetical protein